MNFNHTAHLKYLYEVRLLMVLAFTGVITACSIPLGEPRWSINKAKHSDSTYRFAVLTYDENGIAQPPAIDASIIDLGDTPRMQDTNFKNRVFSRLPSTCVYSEIVRFLKIMSPEGALLDAGSLSEEECASVMSGGIPEKPNQSFEHFIQDAKTLTVVVFVHGWKNTADQNNQNLLQFKDLLGNLATEIGDAGHKVYGIYLGWPGADYQEPLQTLRFWDRKHTADEVSRTDLQIDLLRLQKLWRVDRELLATKRNCGHIACGLRLVVAGHSFGARIVFNIVQPYFIDGALSSSIADHRKDGGPIQLALACKSTRDQSCRTLDTNANLREVPPPTSPRAIYDEEIEKLTIRCTDPADCKGIFAQIEDAIVNNSYDIRLPHPLVSVSNPLLSAENLPSFVELKKKDANFSESLEIRYLDGSASYLPIEQITANPKNSKASSQFIGFGDMVVLLNPAFEASRFLPLTEIQDAHTFKPDTKNSLVVLSTENDSATKTAFPFAKGLESGFGGGENGRLARTTVGNYESNVFTMRNMKIMSTDSHGNSVSNESSTSSSCDTLEEERVLPSMCNDENLSNVNQAWCDAQSDKVLPFMVASTPKSFMNGHSDVFNQCVADYLARIVTKKLIQ